MFRILPLLSHHHQHNENDEDEAITKARGVELKGTKKNA